MAATPRQACTDVEIDEIRWSSMGLLPVLMPLAITRLAVRHSWSILFTVLRKALPRLPLCQTLRSVAFVLVISFAVAVALIAALLTLLVLALVLLIVFLQNKLPPVDTLYFQVTRHRLVTEEEDYLCAICLDDVSLKQDAYVVTPCRHYFHKSCFNGWARRSRACGRCTRPLSAAYYA